ncbi:hypothetical protein [Streptacidiphilus sp. MAP12-16]|uniref:hypothetical protein n=1 Tax=Streptacidiphilus sp. MAP12-16 TaxID=3156300 RepID=UPI0035152984
MRRFFTFFLPAAPLAIGGLIYLLLTASGFWAVLGMVVAGVIAVVGISAWFFVWMIVIGLRNWQF